jgi:hypothetical protein
MMFRVIYRGVPNPGDVKAGQWRPCQGRLEPAVEELLVGPLAGGGEMSVEYLEEDGPGGAAQTLLDQVPDLRAALTTVDAALGRFLHGLSLVEAALPGSPRETLDAVGGLSPELASLRERCRSLWEAAGRVVKLCEVQS